MLEKSDQGVLNRGLLLQVFSLDFLFCKTLSARLG